MTQKSSGTQRNFTVEGQLNGHGFCLITPNQSSVFVEFFDGNSAAIGQGSSGTSESQLGERANHNRGFVRMVRGDKFGVLLLLPIEASERRDVIVQARLNQNSLVNGRPFKANDRGIYVSTLSQPQPILGFLTSRFPLGFSFDGRELEIEITYYEAIHLPSAQESIQPADPPSDAPPQISVSAYQRGEEICSWTTIVSSSAPDWAVGAQNLECWFALEASDEP